ncbi:NADPH:quinone oxidoreductase family protein [Arthrobacter sp. zg-Y820]|uniref:NADPH:quinone oxidoreductase family protein n=1 Tax=unclassified Arthrobacter TaxID=235627 RepID=UPI001E3BA745|nr:MULTISPECIES: NADPH:quinone oxidoreductase family protein [unclassified Arthrobacter]MCC9196071.1 NADPH:quinone oxidoreductase family protein [Arthrobacter sp. zg-Y820]MDK1278930.1 NADPH:quinone oxidoreductase family protein [Arthrobacter sp. zg.Y820]WIB08656.1 NADPH:quinone oxidoreductase family protein [Arthrobacter sp. zg-Y820]
MKAWNVVTNAEPREALRLTEQPSPVAAPGCLVLSTLAVALNFPDVLLCRGEYQEKPPLPFVPGIELCGTVTGIGDGVTGFHLGDRVIASHLGVMAEEVQVPAASAFPAPASLSDAEAAALCIGYQTGYFGLHRRARIAPGETLLVHAAAGGVGTAAVQLGKAAGATVIGVVGNEAKRLVAQEAGADLVVNRTTEDFVEVVKSATGGRGADVIYDPVGGETFERSTRCIAFEGRIVVVGFAGGTLQSARMNHALVKNYSLLGLHWALYAKNAPQLVAEAHEQLTLLADKGLIRPLVTEIVPFESAPDAVQRLGDGLTAGRVVLTR